MATTSMTVRVSVRVGWALFIIHVCLWMLRSRWIPRALTRWLTVVLMRLAYIQFRAGHGRWTWHRLSCSREDLRPFWG